MYKFNEEELKNEIKNEMKKLDINLWNLERHLVFDDCDVYQYLEENEYDIDNDDLGEFQKLWIKTRDYTSSLIYRYGNEITRNIIEDMKDETN